MMLEESITLTKLGDVLEYIENYLRKYPKEPLNVISGKTSLVNLNVISGKTSLVKWYNIYVPNYSKQYLEEFWDITTNKTSLAKWYSECSDSLRLMQIAHIRNNGEYVIDTSDGEALKRYFVDFTIQYFETGFNNLMKIINRDFKETENETFLGKL